jgi:hypothetical protein
MVGEQENLYRPFLALAVFCERVLREGDGTLSTIRIIDRFTIMDSPPQMPLTNLKFTVLIGFKSAHKHGPATIKFCRMILMKSRFRDLSFTQTLREMTIKGRS